jgi:phage/plasmid-associated DNA primase
VHARTEKRGFCQGLLGYFRKPPSAGAFEVQFWDPAVRAQPDEVRPDHLRQDKGLDEKLRAELPGILAWCVRGCLDWRRDGLREPAIVCASTAEYAKDMDEVGQFVDEYCELGADFMVAASELYKAFKEAMPNSRLNQHSFGTRLTHRGFLNRDPQTGKDYRTNKGKHGRKGLRLRSEAEQE